MTWCTLLNNLCVGGDEQSGVQAAAAHQLRGRAGTRSPLRRR